MADVINTNVFDTNKKFVDFAGLDYFWGKAKTYIDGVDASMSAKVLANENAIKAINDELNTLSGGVGSVGTQIDNAIAALNLPDTYEAKGAAAQALVDAKAYADGLADNYDAAGAAAQALVDAKAYADGLADNYDAAGAAAQALADAKTYVDGKDSAMDARVKVLEAIDHDALAANAAAAAVATVLDDAPEAFDTLKEVAEWISNNDHASDVATLVTDVANLKAIDHTAYVAADEAVLTNAKAYTDEEIGKLSYDAAGAAAQALVDAKAYTDEEIGKLSYDAAGSAAQALVDAKAYADGLAVNYDAAGAAATAKAEAIADAKVYADGLASNYDAAGAAATAKAEAIAQAKADATEVLKSYYTKTEVDNLLSTNSTGDRAYAKQYTDELFNSFKFAQNSDIDALFAAKAE